MITRQECWDRAPAQHEQTIKQEKCETKTDKNELKRPERGRKKHHLIITLLIVLCWFGLFLLGFLRVKERVLVSQSSGGPWRHSGAGLWGPGLWRLSGSLEEASGTGWLGWPRLGVGRGPSWLCGGGPVLQRACCEGAGWGLWIRRGHPSLWGPAGTWASEEDCRPEESPNCCPRMLGYLQYREKK